MPTPTLRIAWRGRVRGELKAARNYVQKLINYNAKPQVQASRPLFTPQMLADMAAAVLDLTALLTLKIPR